MTMVAKQLLISKRQIAYLHVLANRNQLFGEDYREVLATAAGVASSSDLKRCDFDRVLDFMDSIGLDVGERRKVKAYGHRPGRATPKQLHYIDGLRAKVFGGDHEQAFNRWLEHYFHIAHMRFLTSGTARKVIEGLKAMRDRNNRTKGGAK